MQASFELWWMILTGHSNSQSIFSRKINKQKSTIFSSNNPKIKLDNTAKEPCMIKINVSVGNVFSTIFHFYLDSMAENFSFILSLTWQKKYCNFFRSFPFYWIWIEYKLQSFWWCEMRSSTADFFFCYC